MTSSIFPGNLVPDLPDYNLFAVDVVLREAVLRHASAAQQRFLSDYGDWLGRQQTRELAARADRQPPRHEAYDRLGQRVDRVEFGPDWHRLMAGLREHGLVSLPYHAPTDGAWLTWAAGLYLHGQVDAASLCPTIMTTAAIPVLQQEPAVFAGLQEALFSTVYDDRDVPLGQKASMLVGMGMTEKQGGTDLRAITTRAEPLAEPGRGQAYHLTGHKWFFSSPTSDAHLVLAQTPEGPSCFFVPRWHPAGVRNGIRLVRLKDKLGNRANASGEVEFDQAWGLLVGEPGRGIPTLLQMATFSRLACVIGSTAIQRQTLLQAVHHARWRHVGGRPLIEQPLMTQVLADMALESEAATALMLRLALAFEQAEQPVERVWCRVIMPAAKFWICKRTVELAGEALEVWGGNGYVETGPMARWFREAPVNSVWEGSGNVMCLDVLRALRQDPEGFEHWLDGLAHLGRERPLFAEAMAALRAELMRPAEALETAARRLVQHLVLVAQAALLLEHAPADVAEGFLWSRFDGAAGRVFGAGPALPQAGRILARVWGEAAV